MENEDWEIRQIDHNVYGYMKDRYFLHAYDENDELRMIKHVDRKTGEVLHESYYGRDGGYCTCRDCCIKRPEYAQENIEMSVEQIRELGKTMKPGEFLLDLLE